MLTYVIVVNDNGELKTVTEQEIEDMCFNLEHGYSIEGMVSAVLDKRETTTTETKD